MATCLAGTKIGLRVFQVLFALIAFAAAASLNTSYEAYQTPFVRFMVFTGVTSFLLALFYSIVSCVEGLKRTFSGLVEVAVNVLWVVFWLAAAGSFAAFATCRVKDASLTDFATLDKCGVFLASEAFAWLSWLLWIGSLLISIVEMRRGEGLTGGAKRYPMGSPGV